MANLFLKMYLHLLKHKVDKLPPEEAFRRGRNFSHVLHEAQMVCYESAAQRGYARAQYELADLLADFDDDWEAKEVEAKALYWYEKAAAQGHMESQYRAATYYFKGRGCTKDFAKAQYWYEICLPELKAKNRSDASTVERNLREIQVHGTTPPPRRQPTPPAPAPQPVPAKTAEELFLEAESYTNNNPSKALQLYEQAANKHHNIAQYICGQMYEKGIGCNQNWDKASFWYSVAAAYGHKDAQYAYANTLRLGLGCRTKKFEEALFWFEQAAKQGHADAQVFCGSFYYSGFYCDRDLQKAKYWYQKAAAQGNQEAVEFLNGMDE